MVEIIIHHSEDYLNSHAITYVFTGIKNIRGCNDIIESTDLLFDHSHILLVHVDSHKLRLYGINNIKILTE